MKRHEKSGTPKLRAMRWISILIIFALIAVVIYGYVIEEVKNAEQSIVTEIEDDKFDHLYSYLEVLRNQACSEAKKVSTSIEYAMMNHMDLNELRQDFDNGVFNQELYETIRNTIEGKSLNNINNYKNGIIIMSNDGIYEDLSYGRAINNEEDVFRLWEYEIARSYNAELEANAVKKLLEHSDEIIMSEPLDYTNNKKHIKISDASYETLKKVYKEEGIEGFKNYQVYVPAYITDTGDIFGQNDIVRGVKQPTHKIIIVQEFNLYDQIEHGSGAFDHMFETLSEDIDYISIKFHYLIVALYLLGILIIVGLVISICLFTKRYNTHIDEYENNNL